ncbi:UNVERIFIED_CONTAM: hypothetical protein GTU68_021472 [Idotea baltica]|nr:hypothetical protein [Idotea baltica]
MLIEFSIHRQYLRMSLEVLLSVLLSMKSSN